MHIETSEILGLAVIGHAWISRVQGPAPVVNGAAWVFAGLITGLITGLLTMAMFGTSLVAR